MYNWDTSPIPVYVMLSSAMGHRNTLRNLRTWMHYAALPWQKEPTDIFGKIKLSLGLGDAQGWWYLPNKLINIQLPWS